MTTRDALTAHIEYLGGRVANTVSRRTDLLLVGTDPGAAKLARATTLGTPILSLHFWEYLGLSDERAGPRGLLSIPDDMLSNLAILLATYTEECYGQYLRHGTSGYWFAFIRGRDATRRLLHLAWGPALSRDVQDRAAVTIHHLRLEAERARDDVGGTGVRWESDGT
jgi:hypothetical protein